MDRRQLEYFLAVAGHGSFTSAASALRVAQPSLSHAIKSLERDVGAELFHRLGRGVRLTTAGEAMMGPARQVLLGFAAAQGSVRRVTQLGAGRLEIVALTTLAVNPLAPLVGAFRRAHPGVSVAIHDPEHAAAVADMVRTGHCELGVADFSVPSGDLRAFELPPQQMLVVLPPDADLGPGASMTVADVAALDLIVTPLGTTTRTLVESVLAGAGTSLSIAVETPHRAAIVPLVLTGAGATLLPRPMAEDAARQGARIALIEPPTVRRVRLLWRSAHVSPAAQAFIDLVTSSDGRP